MTTGFIRGLEVGAQYGRAIGGAYRDWQKENQDKEIGEALRKEHTLIDDVGPNSFDKASDVRAVSPEQAEADVDKSFAELSSLGGPALSGPSPVAPLPAAPQVAPSSVAAIDAASQISPQGLRLQVSPQFSQEQVAAPRVAQPIAPQTSEQIAAQTKLKQNPLQDYMRYQEAANIAAKYGRLDQREAYSKMAQSAFKTGVGAYTLEALNKLQQGDASGVQSFMTNVMPDGYRYADFVYDPNTRTITGRQIGADGDSADDYTLSEDAVLGMARQLTTDENTVNKLYEARAAADAELLKFQREMVGKQFQSGLDTNKDITVEKYRQVGRMELAGFNQSQQNSRFGAQLSLDWFKAGNDAAYKNGMLKLRQREVDGKLQGNERANVKFWDSLGYNPEEINLAEQLVNAGNSVAQVNSAVGGGMDISRTQFTPGVGATVPVAGGGAVKVNIDGLLKMVDDPEQVEAVRSRYVSSATSAFDQGFAGWRDKWSTWTPKQRRDVLEAQGVGMDPDQFATYAGLTPKAPVKKPQPKAGGLRVDTGGGRVYDPAAVAQAAARDNANRVSSERARAQKVLAEENARRAKSGLPPLAP